MNKHVMSIATDGRSKPILYFPCSAYGLRTIQIPGELNAKDFKAYLERRIPTLFPARSERIRSDFQRGIGGSCTVFVCDVDVEAELAGGVLDIRRSTAVWRLRGSGLVDGVRIVSFGEYAEVARLKDGVTVSVQIIGPDERSTPIEALVLPTEIVELVCDDGFADTWLHVLSGIGVPEVRRFPLSALLPGEAHRGVFSGERDESPLFKAFPYIGVAALGMAALFSIGYVSSRYEHAMNRLNVHRTGLASTSMDAGELARRRDTLRAELMSYGESAPSAATILAELASICSASLVVDRFSISNGRFEVWAISSDALAELMTMETDLRFSEVTLKGIVPGSDGREGFSLTGKYND